MRNSVKALVISTALVAGLSATPALYAQGSDESQGGSMISLGMMDQGGMKEMMNMMGQMSQMMGTCHQMMGAMPNDQGSSAPTDQRK